METLILVILAIFPGVCSGGWGVTFSDQCAFKGTTVIIKCEYDYPSGHFVTSVGWYKAIHVSGETRLISLSSITSDPEHFIYLGNKWDDCTLKINNVQPSDEGAYYFDFKTMLDRWRSKSPARLTVTELTAVVKPSTVTEGETVRLTCLSRCPGNAVWFRDRLPVSLPSFQATRGDAGMYRCGLYGQERVRSTSVALNVQYAPRKVSLSVSPSAVAIRGSSVNFTCSSDANPPVAQSGYSLFKDGQFISLGSHHNISDLQPGHSGLYHCQACNNISGSGGKLCNSAKVQLNIQYAPMNVSVSMDPLDVTEGSSVNLTCSSSSNPAAQNYTWYKRTTSASSSVLLQMGSGPLLSLPSVQASDAGHYLCQARNTLGESRSSEMLLSMNAGSQASLLLPVLAGVGVFLLLTLLFAFVLFRRKQKEHAQKHQTEFDLSLGGRSSSPAAPDDPSNSVYMNISALHPPAQDVPHQSHDDASTAQEDDVTYSAVTINSRKNNHQIQRSNNRDMKDSWSTAGDNDVSVVYAAVVKSS